MTRGRPLDGPRQRGVDMLSRERLEVYAGLVRRAGALAWSEDSPAEPRGGR
jgi:hypothetical protein